MSTPTASRRVSQRRPFSESPIGRVGAVFVHFSRRSTIHGLNHMAQARTNKRRMYWLLISLCASTGFFVNLYYLFDKYLQIPVLTNVLHDYAEFEFPDITFCLLNPIYFPPKNTSALNELMGNIKQFVEYRKTNSSWVRALSDYLFMNTSFSYSHPAWAAIVQCAFRRMSNCSHKSFIVRRLWPYGNCFTLNATMFNSKSNVNWHHFRPDFRIIVHKSLSYPEDYRIDPHGDPWMSSGIIVMIHEAQTFPHIEDSFLVDGVTQIDIKITKLHHLPQKNNCQEYRDTITYYDNLTGKAETFKTTPSECMDSLKQKLLAKWCGCIPFYRSPLYSLRGYPFCYKFSRAYLNRCFQENNAEMQHVSARKRKMCLKDLCKHTAFSTVISQAKYPAIRERNTYLFWLNKMAEMEQKEIAHFGRSDFSERALLGYGSTHNISLKTAALEGRIDLLNVDFVDENFMMLRVVAGSLFMDRIEEVAEYPLSRLLSDIGGCVGLWIGASLITLFEFIDLMFDFADQTVVYQRRKVMRKKSAMNGKYSYSSVPATLYNGSLKAPTSGLCPIPPLLESRDGIGDVFGHEAEEEFKNDIAHGLCVVMGNPSSVPTSDSELSTPMKTISTDLVTTV